MYRWTLLIRTAATVFCLTAISLSGSQSAAQDWGIELDQQFNRAPARDALVGAQAAADRLLRLGRRQEAEGQPLDAIESWRQALEQYQQLGDLAAIGQVYEYMGLAYAGLGRYAEAEDAMRRRLSVARDNRDFQGQIYGLNNLGVMLMQRQDLQAAQTLFYEALNIAYEVGSSSGQGVSLSNLGMVAAARGDYATAIERLEAAVPLRRRSEDPSGEASSLNNLGEIYGISGRSFDALRSHLAALSLSRRILDRPNQLRAIDGLVTVYSATNRFGQAFELLQTRQELTQNQGDRRQQLITARSLAEFYQRVGDRPLALEFYQQAAALARELQDSQAEAMLMTQIVNLTAAIAAQ